MLASLNIAYTELALKKWSRSESYNGIRKEWEIFIIMNEVECQKHKELIQLRSVELGELQIEDQFSAWLKNSIGKGKLCGRY